MRTAQHMLAGTGFLLMTGICGGAFAQAASQPDKSQYTLFNPVPDDQMRDFNTDRPPKANVPYTVDAGHFQYETDLVNFAGNQVAGTMHTDIWLVPNPTFKFGLTNNMDFEINAPTGVGIHSFDSTTGKSGTVWGVGDVFLRTKINLGR